MSQVPTQYDVAILAGSSEKPDALCIETGESIKALIPLAGRPMISYVIEALSASERVRCAAVVGLAAQTLAPMERGMPLIAAADRGGIIDNCLAALDALGDPERLLICTCDLPLLTPVAINYLVDSAEVSGAALCYSIVSREVMESRFPSSGRSFRRLVEGYFAGGDISMVESAAIRANIPFARALSSNRKSAWGLAKAMGPGIITRFLTRRLRIIDVERRAGHLLNCTCKAIQSPYAELAMDVDKPHHLHIVQRALAEE